MPIVNFTKEYFPEYPNNMSYEETAYYLYGVDIDDRKEEKE